MATISEMTVRIGANISNFQRNISRVTSRITETGNRLQSFGGKLSNMGQNLTYGLSLPLAGIGIASLKMSTDFNKSMANVASLIPGNIKRVQELKKNVQDMAIETGKTTGDLSNGLYQVISAFGDSADSAKILKINAKAAAAGLADTTDAINLTSAVTKGYGDTSAKAVQHVSDLAFQTVKLGQTTLPELAASLGQAVPLAKTLGISMEDLFASEATLTGVTGSTSEVTTGLRAAMQALLAPSKDMQAAMKKLGYSNGQAMVKSLGFKGTLDKLVGVTHGNTAQLSKMFGQVEGLNQVLAITGAQSDVFIKKQKEMKNVTGATETAFKEQTQGVNKAGFQFDQFKEKLQVAAQKMGDSLAPALMNIMNSLQPFFDNIVKLVKWFSNLNPKTQKFIVIIGLMLIALGPVLTILSYLVTVVGGLVTIFGVSAGVIFGVAGIIVAAIAAIIFIVYELIKHWKQIEKVSKKVWSEVVSYISKKLNEAGKFFNNLGKNIEKFFNGLWSSAYGWGKNMIDGFIGGIKSMISKVRHVASSVTHAVGRFLGFHSPSKEGEGRHIVTWGKNMIGGFMDGIDSAVPMLNAKLNKVLSPPTYETSGVNGVSGNQSIGGNHYYEGLFKGANFHVRSDNDIKQLGIEFAKQTRSVARGRGLR